MSKTIRSLSNDSGIKPESLQKKLKRKEIGKFGLDEPLPDDVLRQIQELQPTKAPTDDPKSIQVLKPIKAKKAKIQLVDIIPFLPLPMLGLAASYGVFAFSRVFVPDFVAVIEAAAFELTYIGLACMGGGNKDFRDRAKLIAIGAVATSVIYNTLAAALHLNPSLFQNLHWAWFWTISFLHGCPLAVLAWQVSDLIIHKK